MPAKEATMKAFALSRLLFSRLRRLARSYIECLTLSSKSWPQSLGKMNTGIKAELKKLAPEAMEQMVEKCMGSMNSRG